jgi:kinetochore protein Nuf2
LKLEKTQKHAEDKKLANQKRIEKLQLEYADMVVDRRENDKQIEEVRQEANEVERKVCSTRILSRTTLRNVVDARTSENERS